MRIHILRTLIVMSLASGAIASGAAPSTSTKPAEPTKVAADEDDEKLREGHSYHGEAFNEGPRQAAYLMSGTGNASFPISTKNLEVQKYFNQGVGQLHGFWYFEAERSFRQAASIEPDCAMAYWGMCLANTNNASRAGKFIEEAVKRREKTSQHERLYIDAWNAFYKADPKKDKDRRQALIKALENILHEYPDDIEAKALLVLHIWQARGPIPIGSHQAVDALIDQVLEKNPMHPIHHFRIHLWDDQKAIRALGSAALGGQSQPGIAHMWHMPGHTFSKLQRYADAAWQQEAASRVDHAYMRRDFVLPDQIHNYAHNHEWLIRDLSNIGRAHYGVELAENLVEMPQHPKYNSYDKKSSTAGYGRARLLEVLQRYELWDELLALADTPYLEPTDVPREQVKRLRALGVAAMESGRLDPANEYQEELEELLAKEQTAQKAAGDKAEAASKQKKEPKDKVTKARNDAVNPFRGQISLIESALADVQARKLVREKKFAEAITQLKKAGITGGEYLSRVELAAGNKPEAEKLARAAVAANKNQVLPLANLAFVLRQCGKNDGAKQTFAELRMLAGEADLDVPPLARLSSFAAELGWPADWRTPPATKGDVGVRPPLDSLGPIRWTPPLAPPLQLTTLDGQPLSLEQYRARNVLLVFYLGFGCLHCVDQLKALKADEAAFAKEGIEIVAISTDSPEALRTAMSALAPAETYPFTIVSGSDLSAFRRYRAYDDFENQPLHATVLVDASGQMRWWDVSAEPFSDVKFLLKESRRLLRFTSPTEVRQAADKAAE